MNFHIITIFPESIQSYFDSSILGRAQKSKKIKISLVDLKKFAKGRHGILDDKIFGGGPGMVMKVEPIIKSIESILKSKLQKQNNKQITNSKSKNLKQKTERKVKVLITAPAGTLFTQEIAKNYLKKYTDIIILCGRYEGIDARVGKAIKDLLKDRLGNGHSVEEISIGDYVLTGGELPAAVIVDTISRHVDGVLGKKESLEDTRGVGIPVYTRPEIYLAPVGVGLHNASSKKTKAYGVPKVLLSGHHRKIEEWRQENKKSTPGF